jgi:hypothetical protein
MKTTRRRFIQSATAAAAVPFASGAAAGRISVGIESCNAVESATHVPDTLDLVQNGNDALNGLAGTLDWGKVPEFYFRVELRPPRFIHDRHSFAACGPKYGEAFVMLRTMTGSDRFLDIQDRYRQYLLSCIEEDGLFYCKISPQRPWDNSSPEDTANIYGNGRMIRALIAEYDHDGNPEWLEWARKISGKLAEIGIYKDDYVYFPTTPGYGDMYSYPKSGWKITEIPRQGPEASIGPAFGIPMYLGGTILPLVRLAERTQDERTLDLATKLTRFLMRPGSAWLPSIYSRGVNPGEHAEYQGQTHAHMMALRGILACGVATNNNLMKNFAREGYEFSRNLGIVRLGWFQEEVGKHSHETCALADMISLALQLSKAGLGDYWDDVDGYARNHLTEGRFVNLEKLRALNPGLTSEDERWLERALGTYSGWGSPVALSTVLQNCCMANGGQALYSVWQDIVTYDPTSATAKVNLLLNRHSPWLDVESYLPYEGKVVLRNKNAQHVYVRIPTWVDRQGLACRVDGQTMGSRYLENHLLLDAVNPRSVITVTFPVREEVQTYTCDDYGEGGWAAKPISTFRYRATFRGNTAITLESLQGDQTITYDGGRLRVTPVYTAYVDRGFLGKNDAPLKPKVAAPSSSKEISSW